MTDGYDGRQPIAGVFPILFDLEGYGGNVLSLAQVQGDRLVTISQGDYRVKCQVDGAMQVTMLMEYLGRLK